VFDVPTDLRALLLVCAYIYRHICLLVISALTVPKVSSYVDTVSARQGGGEGAVTRAILWHSNARPLHDGCLHFSQHLLALVTGVGVRELDAGNEHGEGDEDLVTLGPVTLAAG
jgi:hypothetical protein